MLFSLCLDCALPMSLRNEIRTGAGGEAMLVRQFRLLDPEVNSQELRRHVPNRC